MLTLDTHAIQIEEEKCFGANQTLSSVLYDTGTTTKGTALAGGLASAGDRPY